MKNLWRIMVGLGIIAFGLMTLYLSGSVIFDLFGMRAKQGNYVMFVIIANFICGFLYLIGGYKLLTLNLQAKKIFGYALLILLLTFIAFLIYVQMGGVHKTDTFKALGVRTTTTTIAYITTFYTLTINKKSSKKDI